MTMDQKGCRQRPGAKTAGAIVYLMEELGDARMRCDQLVRYVDEAVKLLEKSPQREAVFEAAGHLVQGIPGTLFKLDKALQAVALAATRIDYEEIKQELKPEKVQQLEKVLQDVRIRHVQRRSQPWEDPQQAVNYMSTEQRVMAADRWKVTAHDWTSHFSKEVMQLASPEQVREKFKKENPKLDDKELDEIVGQWMKNKDVVKDKSAAKRPTFDAAKKTLMDHLKSEGWKVAEGLKIPHATSPDGQTRLWFKTQAVYMSLVHGKIPHTMDGARSIHVDIRDLSPEQFMAKVKQWSKDASLSKDASAWKASADDYSGKVYVVVITKDGKRSKEGPFPATDRYREARELLTSKLADPDVKSVNFERAQKTKSAGDEEKESKFEEGKPADPTENMSPEDAKQWKAEHAKNKDNFKAAAVKTKADFDKLQDEMRAHLDTFDMAWSRYEKDPEKNKAKLDDALRYMKSLRDVAEVLIRNMETVKGGKTACDDDKMSKFEEGKPADPTENMDADDAAKWKVEHDKNKDRFKAAAQPWEADELDDMEALLKKHGYDPKDAKKLQQDGMGPYELEHRIKTTKPGEMGSLEYTHGLKKKASDLWKVAANEFPELNKLAKAVAVGLDEVSDGCEKLSAEMKKTEGWYAPDLDAEAVKKLGKLAEEHRKEMFGWGGLSFVKKK